MVMIATWNVNSAKMRLPHITDYLQEAKPDILLLQEIKCIDENFPAMEIEDLGYNVAVHGQKSFNGVAILSRLSLEDIRRGLPGDDDDPQARYLEAVVGGTMRVASIYLPNGNPIDGEKFTYKLSWMKRLYDHAAALLAYEEPLILAGDYNVIPTDDDVWDPAGWEEDALAHPETRRHFRALLNLGFTDAYRALHPELGGYSYWDYKAGAWNKDYGLRIDHLLLSPQAADRLEAADIDKTPRGKEKPSDHTPVWCRLTD